MSISNTGEGWQNTELVALLSEPPVRFITEEPLHCQSAITFLVLCINYHYIWFIFLVLHSKNIFNDLKLMADKITQKLKFGIKDAAQQN